MKRFIVFALLLLSMCVVRHDVVRSVSLRIQPLIYKETITGADRKRGYIDIANPSGNEQTISVAVKGFKQVDNGNRLEFFDSAQLKEAIVVDKKSFKILPQQAVRVFFGVEGKKLPSGDVLAAIIFTTGQKSSTKGRATVSQAASVGTLLTLLNPDDSAHKADIVKLDVDFFQLGLKLHGSYTLKNTAPEGSANAFYPVVERMYSPFGKPVKQQTSLLSAGVVRTTELSSSENMFGLYKLTVSQGTSVKDVWVFTILGWGWAIAASIFSLFAALIVMIFKLRERRPKT